MDGLEDRAEKLAPTLAEACRVFGIDTWYWDIWGRRRYASEEALRAVLTSLGVDASSDDSLGAEISAARTLEWQRPLPNTLVVCSPDFPLRLPASRAASNAKFAIDLEDGGHLEWMVELGAIAAAEEREVEGVRFVRKQVQPPAAIPLGYHTARVTMDGLPECACRLIVSPERAWQPERLAKGRAAGIGVSLYSLRSARNWGCGDFTDLAALIDWCSEEVGASFIGLNPLHSIANRAPYNTSPYLPNSSLYRNCIYLDIESIEDFGASDCARALRSSPAIQREIQSLRESPWVEYERVSRLKLCFLKVLFRSFLACEHRRDTERAREFSAYVRAEGQMLHLFSIHAALDEAQHRRNAQVWNWCAWPDAYQDPASPEVEAFAQAHWRTVLLHKYIQWQIELQLKRAQQHALSRGLRIGLYHDLALATDRCGADVWAHRRFYASGCRVGAPPDDYSPAGQDWGFPPPNSKSHYLDGYRLFSEGIRHSAAHGGALRIDHVMRLFRLYWIAPGSDASHGTYVRERWRDLLRVLALESVRGRCVLIGEDLGTITDEARDALREFGILSYRLLYFEQDSKGRFRRPEEYPRQALVSITTHDLPTLAGFWEGHDIEVRQKSGLIADRQGWQSAMAARAAEKQKILNLLHEQKFLPDWFPREARLVPHLTGELHNAVVGFLASTPSQLFLLGLEDLFKELEQQNLAGITSEYPNWRRKLKLSVEEMRSGEARAYTGMLRAWLERTGRVNG